jgi:hypothetical protein
MAYKSNRKMRAEYLANEQKNRERNRAGYERRKRRKSRASFLLVFVVVVIALYLVKQRSEIWPRYPAFTPTTSHPR